eukprot:5816006-Ditylum_brightwellii.AAC.1
MPSKKKRCDVGAVCSVIKRFLHPRKLVDEKYPNATYNECLDGLIALRRETCTVNHQQKQVVVFCHKDSKVLEEALTIVETPPLINNMLEDIAYIQAEGLGVDDDNEPAPENILTASTADIGSQSTIIQGEWDIRASLMSAAATECDHNAFWGKNEPNTWIGAPSRLNHIMSSSRFEEIISTLTFTKSAPPSLKDK